MIGTCAKQVVKATIITADGQRFFGTNHCLNAQAACPRGSLPSGVGYEMCRDVCSQPAHAEVNALAQAIGSDLTGATLYLEGHTYACRACSRAVREAGLTNEIIIGAPPAP